MLTRKLPKFLPLVASHLVGGAAMYCKLVLCRCKAILVVLSFEVGL